MSGSNVYNVIIPFYCLLWACQLQKVACEMKSDTEVRQATDRPKAVSGVVIICNGEMRLSTLRFAGT